MDPCGPWNRFGENPFLRGGKEGAHKSLINGFGLGTGYSFLPYSFALGQYGFAMVKKNQVRNSSTPFELAQSAESTGAYKRLQGHYWMGPRMRRLVQSLRKASWVLMSGFAVAGCSGDKSSAGVVEPPLAAEVDGEAISPTSDSGANVREPLIEIVQLESETAGREAAAIRGNVSLNLMDGFEVKLWASDKLLGDPVAMDIDSQGRVFVTQTRRHKRSEFDIRAHSAWQIPSITWETVEDRRAFLRQELAPERSDQNRWLADLNQDGSRDWRDLTVLTERVFKIEDTTGDGLADRSQVLYEGFNTEVSDIAAGVLAHGEDVYVTVAPDLWRLRDTTGDGWADEKESIVHGFGVHVGFSGHGLSGPREGPDGRIYWAIGDYGGNIEGPDGQRWEYPHTGIVVRANFDGTDFEVFASGLRNPHEFAFDEYGNLISVDNDGDHSGEHERVVYLIDGSDSGWRIHWQFGKYADPTNNRYNVWMDEQLFKPRFEGQAAYILPPVAAFRSGPSGLAYNPGTALSERWKNFVFVSQFRGAAPRSGITAFRLEESGAGFELAEQHDVLMGMLPTSVAFGPDGALYMSDWVSGWEMNGKGQIWKLDTPETIGSGLRQQTQELLAADFGSLAETDLLEPLRHPDMRVRLKAQFELVGRGDAGVERLRAAALQKEHRLARIHGIWGLGQRVRQGDNQAEFMVELLQDADSEIRAQAARTLGDVRAVGAGSALIPLLADEAPRARMFAAEALGRLAHGPAVEGIKALLIANDDEDAYLRHAGAIALGRIGRAEEVAAWATHPSRALRLAAVVALRRMGDPGVAAFLADEDLSIVTEAARAINDERSIPAALPALARMLEAGRFNEEALVRRSINANLRLGGAEEAGRVARYAAKRDAPHAMREEAMQVLGVWARPSVLDRVDGFHRGPVERDPAVVRNAVAPVLETLLTGPGRASVRVAAAAMAARLQLSEAGPMFVRLLETDSSASVRAAALNALQAMQSDYLPDAVAVALGDAEGEVRRAALRMAPTLTRSGGALVAMLAGVIHEDNAFGEQQTALESLGRLADDAEAELVLAGLLDRLATGEIAREIRLDLVEAAAAHGGEIVGGKLGDYLGSKPEGVVVEAYIEATHGGGIDAGRRLFREHPSTSCARCHAVGGEGGDAGPDLTKIGSLLTRKVLLESLVAPSARIAPGYGIVFLELNGGGRVIGTLRAETEEYLEMDVGGELQRVRREEVVGREDAPSSMPSTEGILTARQLRDLVEYLASLQ